MAVDSSHGELPLRTYVALRDLIIRGRLAPGARVRESDVSERFGISRTPAREALMRLKQEGFVVEDPNSAKTRLRVAPLATDDVFELWSLIGSIEGQALARVDRRSSAQRARLANALAGINSRLIAADAARPRVADLVFDSQKEFHEHMVHALAGPRTRLLYDIIRPHVERYEWAHSTRMTAGLRTSTHEHEEVIERIRQGDGAAARIAIEAHWSKAAKRTAHVIGLIIDEAAAQPLTGARRGAAAAMMRRAATLTVFLFCGAPATEATAQPDVQPRSAVVETETLVQRADSLTRLERWPEARDAWRRVLAANPHLARGWYMLGTVERNSGNRASAIGAFAKYLEQGGAPPIERAFFGGNAPADVAYAVAGLHAAAGHQDSAAHWLQHSLELGLRNPFRIGRDSTFRGLWTHPRFARFVATRAKTREEGWKADVAYLRNEIRRVHAGPNANMRAVEAAADRLMADIPSLSEGAFVVRVQRMLALAGSGHTVIALEGIERWNNTLPVNFETLSDSLYIVAADRAYADLVGARIIAVGGKPVGEALAMLDSLASVDNRFGVYRARARFLRWPQLSFALGLAPTDTTASFLVETLGGVRKSVTIRARSNRYADFSGGPAGYTLIAGAPAWATVDSLARSAPLPLSRRDLRTPYWFTHMPDKRTVYFAFNSVVDASTESLARFAARLLRFVDSAKVDRLIVDLRANNGGNSRLLLPLTDGIAASRVNRPGGLYVLIGPYTYSAAMNAATLLERHTQATFVGEPTPSPPNWVGESNNFYLPYSRVTLSVSDVYWQTSWPFDQRKWIAPSVYLPPTLAMRRARRDAALEAVLAAPLRSPTQ